MICSCVLQFWYFFLNALVLVFLILHVNVFLFFFMFQFYLKSCPLRFFEVRACTKTICLPLTKYLGNLCRQKPHGFWKPIFISKKFARPRFKPCAWDGEVIVTSAKLIYGAKVGWKMKTIIFNLGVYIYG